MYILLICTFHAFFLLVASKKSTILKNYYFSQEIPFTVYHFLDTFELLTFSRTKSKKLYIFCTFVHFYAFLMIFTF